MNVITHFTLLTSCSIRIAGTQDRSDDGTLHFVYDGQVWNNDKYDNRWHKFPSGTIFHVAALVDKTDTYLLIADEPDSDSEDAHNTQRVKCGVFCRRRAFESLLSCSDWLPVKKIEEDIEFGAVLSDMNFEESDETKHFSEMNPVN